MRKALGFLLLVAAILAISMLRTRRGPSRAVCSQREFLMGTLVEIKVAGLDRGRADKAIAAAFEEMKKIDSLAARTGMGDVFRLNTQGEAEVSPDIAEMIRRSILYGEMTGGGFDITIYPVLKRWSYFDELDVSIPGEQELADLLALVDYRKVKIQDRTVRLAADGMGIDLGAIAKGYAVDRAVEVLEEHGVAFALVEAGGDIRVMGAKGDGSPWRIGLRHPRKSGILTTFELTDRAICTSGDYEKFFIRDGVRYHHILDPGDGCPADGCCSVTVVALDATAADVLATGVFVLGPEMGVALIDSLEDVEGVIVSERDGGLEIKISQGLRGKLAFNP